MSPENALKNEVQERIIDGSYGEGGGQILRTSLALSIITGQPFTLNDIRSKRKRPGILSQHLTCIQAAQAICDAEVKGASPGSQSIRFKPGMIRHGNYEWSIGSAGSTTLVLQTILFPLLLASGSSTIRIEGGTHNGMSPPFDFLKRSFIPILDDIGYSITLSLLRYGFYPAGGGIICAGIAGKSDARSKALDMQTREIRDMEVYAWSSKLPERIGKAEVEIIGSTLGISPEKRRTYLVDSSGPGNVVAVNVILKDGVTTFTSFGRKGLPLGKVAADCIAQVVRYLDSGARIDEHMQDQLLLPLSLGLGGQFTTLRPSLHTDTNMAIIKQFLDVDFKAERIAADLWNIDVRKTPKGEKR